MKNSDPKEGSLLLCDDGKKREVILRKKAIDKGLTRFFTGKPCKYGHLAERKVKTYICLACAREKQKRRHKDKMQNDPEYRDKFLAKRLTKHHKRYQSDPEYRQKFLDRAKAYRSK